MDGGSGVSRFSCAHGQRVWRSLFGSLSQEASRSVKNRETSRIHLDGRIHMGECLCRKGHRRNGTRNFLHGKSNSTLWNGAYQRARSWFPYTSCSLLPGSFRKAAQAEIGSTPHPRKRSKFRPNPIRPKKINRQKNKNKKQKQKQRRETARTEVDLQFPKSPLPPPPRKGTEHRDVRTPSASLMPTTFPSGSSELVHRSWPRFF